MPIKRLVDISILTIAVFCFAPVAWSGQRICFPENKVCIHAAQGESIEWVSSAVKKVYGFFLSIGYSEKYDLEIVFRKEVMVKTGDGDFIRVYGKLGKDNRIYLTAWSEPWIAEQNAYGLKMSKAFYESIIVHEVAHFVAEKIASRKIGNTHSEYIAYVVQLSRMQAELRQAILNHHPLPAFKTKEINLEVMLFNPAVFAVKSYLHFRESKGQYLQEILNGTIKELFMNHYLVFY